MLTKLITMISLLGTMSIAPTSLAFIDQSHGQNTSGPLPQSTKVASPNIDQPNSLVKPQDEDATRNMGANSAGGGSVFNRNDGSLPILVDFLSLKPDFQDYKNLAPWHTLTPPPRLEGLLYHRFDIKTLPIYQLVLQRLITWKGNSPTVIGLIEKALSHMQWRFTPLRLKLISTFEVPESIENSFPNYSLQTTIYYHQKASVWGAWISAPLWNTLGDYTQAGLIIHEALRYIQLGGYEGEFLFDDVLLRSMVAQIMLDIPSSHRTLDDYQLFSGTVHDLIYFSTVVRKKTLELQKRACDKNSSWTKDYPNTFFEICGTTPKKGEEAAYLVHTANYLDRLLEFRILNNLEYNKLDDFLVDTRMLIAQIIHHNVSTTNMDYANVIKGMGISRLAAGEWALKEYASESWIESLGFEVRRPLIKILTFAQVDIDPGRNEIKKAIKAYEKLAQKLIKQGVLAP